MSLQHHLLESSFPFQMAELSCPEHDGEERTKCFLHFYVPQCRSVLYDVCLSPVRNPTRGDYFRFKDEATEAGGC